MRELRISPDAARALLTEIAELRDDIAKQRDMLIKIEINMAILSEATSQVLRTVFHRQLGIERPARPTDHAT
jgi:hypothetical protein